MLADEPTIDALRQIKTTTKGLKCDKCDSFTHSKQFCPLPKTITGLAKNATDSSSATSGNICFNVVAAATKKDVALLKKNK